MARHYRVRRERLKATLFVAVPVGVVLYAALSYLGQLPPYGWGLYSGTSLPAEASGLARVERQEQTEARARLILRAILAFEARHGRLPASLDELKDDLRHVPAPLTSTRPFRYIAQDGKAFIVEWEAWPNTIYERYWLDRTGELHQDL